MTTFKIQIRHDANRTWDVVMTVNPHYRFCLVWRWWTPWCPKIGIVPNLFWAERAALKKAIKMAKQFQQIDPTRVIRETMADGHESKDVIWQNGKRVL
jgi:hypothetical protein